MFDWLGDMFGSAIDAVGSLFGDSGISDTASSVLSDIDIDNSGSIGDTLISDFKPNTDYSSFYDSSPLGLGEGFGMPGYGSELTSAPTSIDSYGNNISPKPTIDTKPNTDPNAVEKPWYSSLLSPSVIGAAITSGAGYLNNMNNIDMAKQAQAAKAEEEKRNSILALAKLKYQLMGKGAPTGGRRAGGRSAGGGGGGASSAQDQQYSASLASGYGQLGNALANIYRG